MLLLYLECKINFPSLIEAKNFYTLCLTSIEMQGIFHLSKLLFQTENADKYHSYTCSETAKDLLN